MVNGIGANVARTIGEVFLLPYGRRTGVHRRLCTGVANGGGPGVCSQCTGCVPGVAHRGVACGRIDMRRPYNMRERIRR